MSWGPNYIYPPPPPSYPPYPPVYGDPNQRPNKSEIKDYLAFARAWEKRKEEKHKRKDEEQKHKGIHVVTKRNFNFVEILLLLVILGPFVGPMWNKFEVLILKMINGN
jgi:hypothetical protein